MTRRLFVAVELPERVRAAIADRIRSLQPIDDLRWSRDTSHVTLRFLGDTATERVPDLTAALATVRQHAFSATLGATVVHTPIERFVLGKVTQSPP